MSDEEFSPAVATVAKTVDGSTVAVHVPSTFLANVATGWRTLDRNIRFPHWAMGITVVLSDSPGACSMPAVFHHPLTVCEAEIDQLGHVNNLVYLRWMLDAAVAHSKVQGWPGTAYQQLGAGWVVRSHHIEYHYPAVLGNQVVVRTWVADMKRVTSLRRFKILRIDPASPEENKPSREILLATAATDWAFISFETRMPKRIPPEVSSAFEIVPDPSPAAPV